jgi:holin-like protein
MLFFFIILLSCQLAGEVIVIATGLPLPGPVVGMALLLTGLLLRGRIPTGLDRMGDALLSHLSLLFVPAGVGVMLHAELLGAELLPIAASVVLSTLLTIAVTALLMQWLARPEAGQ